MLLTLSILMIIQPTAFSILLAKEKSLFTNINDIQFLIIRP